MENFSMEAGAHQEATSNIKLSGSPIDDKGIDVDTLVKSSDKPVDFPKSTLSTETELI